MQFAPQNSQHLQNQSSASWQAHARDGLASLDSKHASPANSIAPSNQFTTYEANSGHSHVNNNTDKLEQSITIH